MYRGNAKGAWRREVSLGLGNREGHRKFEWWRGGKWALSLGAVGDARGGALAGGTLCIGIWTGSSRGRVHLVWVGNRT